MVIKLKSENASATYYFYAKDFHIDFNLLDDDILFFFASIFCDNFDPVKYEFIHNAK